MPSATPSASTTPRDDRRFAELILYVAKATQSDASCGATKLNKILFYADFRAYRKLGRPITGQEYQKLDHGPAPRRLVPVVEQMANDGECAWAERDYYGHPLRKLLALREPQLSSFSAAEIDIVRDVLEDLRNLNATEVSDLSHRFPGWQAAEVGETIPYETVFVAEPRPLSREEQEWASVAIDEFLAEPA